MKGKYINPFTDFGFKKLFGTRKEIAIDFLNTVLRYENDEFVKIIDLTYSDPVKTGKGKQDRGAVFDLFCTDESGKSFIIELQNLPQEFFKDRSLFYSTFPIQEQAPQISGWNYQLNHVFFVGILNFTFDVQKSMVRQVALIDKVTGNIFYEKLNLVYLEMPKFNKKESELETKFDYWMYLLNNLPNLKKEPEWLEGETFELFVNLANIAQLNKEEMRTYDESLKNMWDNYSIREFAIKEGKKAGMEEGFAEGVEKGLEKGVEKGLKKGKIAIASAMKNAGEPLDKIVNYTGLTIDEIKKI